MARVCHDARHHLLDGGGSPFDDLNEMAVTQREAARDAPLRIEAAGALQDRRLLGFPLFGGMAMRLA